MNIKMIPIEIIGFKDDIRLALVELRKVGCIHVDDIADSPHTTARPYVPDRELIQHQERLNLTIARVEGIIDSLECKKGVEAIPSSPDNLDEIQAEIDLLLPKVQRLNSKNDALKAELESLPLYEATLKKLMPIIPAEAHDPNNIVVGVLGSRDHISVLDQIGNEVVQLTTGSAQIYAADLDSSTRAMLIVFPSSFIKDIESILDDEDVTRLRMPLDVGMGLPDRAIEIIRKRINAINEELVQLDESLKSLAGEWCEKLRVWQKYLNNQLGFYSILPNLGETELVFILSGWVPESQYSRVQQGLLLAMENKIFIRKVPETRDLRKNAPVALNNPAVGKPFESLVKLLAIPKYGRIDPTMLMAFFMPIFFGMMLGDIGYGLVILIICLVMQKRFNKGVIRDLLSVLVMGAGWAIVFGALFGELFGSLGENIGLHAIWFERGSEEHISGFLIMTIVVGAAQVLLGLILGVWESIKSKSRHHLLERGGKLISLIGLFLLVSVLVDYLPRGFLTPAIAGLILGIVFLGASLGWLGILMGPIEFISLIGNVLSYLRIAAIGLASIYLAKVANDVAGIVGNIIVGLIIALLIHALNVVLGSFSPTIHSLRLHYVEFFQKFFEGGGKPYQPYQNQE